MDVQMRAFLLFCAINALGVAIFVWVILSTRKPHDVDVHHAYRWRRRFIIVLSGALLVALLLTLPLEPYPQLKPAPQQVVYVVGMQFSFGISKRPIRTEEEWEAATYSSPVRIIAGQWVEFRVTSFDVNHDFAIYTPSGRLKAQVQAMPGYVNRLRVKFDKPGTYAALCLELCGMGHHNMRGVFRVIAPPANANTKTREGAERAASE